MATRGLSPGPSPPAASTRRSCCLSLPCPFPFPLHIFPKGFVVVFACVTFVALLPSSLQLVWDRERHGTGALADADVATSLTLLVVLGARGEPKAALPLEAVPFTWKASFTLRFELIITTTVWVGVLARLLVFLSYPVLSVLWSTVVVDRLLYQGHRLSVKNSRDGARTRN